MEKGNTLYHRLDKFIGIPIVFLLGLFRLKRERPTKQINHIGILHVVSIGDTVLLSAVIADLRKQYPAATITLYAGSTNSKLAELISGLDEVIKISLTNFFETYNVIRKAPLYDIMFDFGSWTRISAIYMNFFSAKMKIGFKSAKQFRHYTFDYVVDHSNKVHELDNYRNLIKDFYSKAHHVPQLIVRVTDKSKMLIESIGKYCILHAWPSGYKSYMKEWPLKNWASLVTSLYSDFDTFVITGGPTDISKSNQLEIEITKLFQSSKKVVNISGKFSIIESVHIISEASLIITVNTGIAHIAAALNVPEVCLHGPTNIDRWGPYNKDTSINLYPLKGNFGYLNYGFEYPKDQEGCMQYLEVNQVINAYKALIR